MRRSFFGRVVQQSRPCRHAPRKEKAGRRLPKTAAGDAGRLFPYVDMSGKSDTFKKSHTLEMRRLKMRQREASPMAQGGNVTYEMKFSF